MTESAAISTLSTLLAVHPNRSMKLSTLANPSISNWSKAYNPTLGPIKKFLARFPHIFHIQDGATGGTDEIALVVQTPANLSTSPGRNERYTSADGVLNELPRETDDLWRPFDRSDSFFIDSERLDKITSTREKYWQAYYQPSVPTSPLFNMSPVEAKLVYEQAFNKCTRLTIRINGVVSENLPATVVKQEFAYHVKAGGSDHVKLFFFKDETYRGKMYSETFATVWAPQTSDGRHLAALGSVVDALNANLLQFEGKTLRLNCVGYGPVASSIKPGVAEVLRRRRISVALQRPLTPSRESEEPMTPVQQQPLPQVPRVKALPTAPLHRSDVLYDKLHAPVVDPQSKYMQDARALLTEKEAQLRSSCAEQRALPKEERCRYDASDARGLEWMGGPDFTLGKGSEGTLYMGLLRDIGEEVVLEEGAEPERILVAVKYCSEKNPYDTEEIKHYVSLKKQPGSVQYHMGFKVKSSVEEINILVQDIGLCSLRKFLAGDEDSSLLPYVLSHDEKFKMTKALCMAVYELHELKPSMTHRDIRPENVLVMPNGTVALTDFGLARRAPHRFKGSSVYIKNRLTTMQPHEVQVRFQNNPRAILEFQVDPSADVFMLGQVIAYVHLGLDPFEDDSMIMDKKPPNLGNLMDQQPWLFHLLTCMLHQDPAKRPSMENALRHPYFCTWSENFDVSLVARLENVLVCESRPADNKTFHTLEVLLAPIERELASAAIKWHQAALPSNLFLGKSKLPPEGTLAFLPNGNVPPRAYPLPHVAQLVKWLRNVRTHYPGSPQQQEALRRTKSLVTGVAADHYETAGDFFMYHPAVEWFLPRVWERSVELLQNCYQRQREFNKRYE
jgi:serine/threonine protein kinase